MNKNRSLLLICLFVFAGTIYFLLLFTMPKSVQPKVNLTHSSYNNQNGQSIKVSGDSHEKVQQVGEPYVNKAPNRSDISSEGSDDPPSPVIPSDATVKLDIGAGESLEFDNLDEAEQWIKQDHLASLRSRGTREETIFLIQESWTQNQKGEPAGLEQWLVRYKGGLFEPPVVFNISDPFKPDFSTPVNSLRSFWTALYFGDAKTLLAHSDTSALHLLRRQFGVSETNQKDTYFFPEPHKKITVLFSGETQIGGNEYVLLFYRREEEERPRDHVFSFHTTFFKRSGNGYLLSEAPRGSQFSDVLTVMGADPMRIRGPYPQFSEQLKESNMPERFYIIE